MPKLTIDKSILIDAPIDKVFATVRDFKQWPSWSPWIIVEPDCILDYADNGSEYSWNGKVIGSGNMVIESEQANRSISYKLSFLKPWKSTSTVSFLFTEKDGKTEARWTMNGSLPFFIFWMKAMMTTAVGMDYERGLKMLKDYIENGSVPSKLEYEGITSVPEFNYIGIKTDCTMENIAEHMTSDMQKVGSWTTDNEIKPSGKPFALYNKYNLGKGLVTYTIGVPVESTPTNLPSEFVSGTVASGKTYAVKHTGPYRHLGNAWSAGIMSSQAKVFKQNKQLPPFEVYDSDPHETPENEILTTVHFPSK